MILPVRVTLDQANAFVAAHHRHHDPTVGHRFSLGAWSGGRLVGVAIVGRPVARRIDQERVVEVLRLCTDGTRNACSWLYTRCVEQARNLGFFAAITYTLSAESGASLRACGWWGEPDATPGRSWDCPSRPRDGEALGPKWRWLHLLNDYDVVLPPAPEAEPLTRDLFAACAHRKTRNGTVAGNGTRCAVICLSCDEVVSWGSSEATP